MCRSSAVRTTVRALIALGVVAMVIPEAATACERCFGVAADSPATRGITLAMLMLIGVTGTVGCGVLVFFNNMRVRAQRIRDGLPLGSDAVPDEFAISSNGNHERGDG